jgi:hypothetical protein
MKLRTLDSSYSLRLAARDLGDAGLLSSILFYCIRPEHDAFPFLFTPSFLLVLRRNETRKKHLILRWTFVDGYFLLFWLLFLRKFDGGGVTPAPASLPLFVFRIVAMKLMYLQFLFLTIRLSLSHSSFLFSIREVVGSSFVTLVVLAVLSLAVRSRNFTCMSFIVL